jgi:hypothetical protein
MVLPELDVGVRGSSVHSARSHSGVSSAVVGTIVQAVKSMPIPKTCAGSAAAARSAAGTAVRSTST